MLAKLAWTAWWKINNWKVIGAWQPNLTRAVIIVGPHTSAWDVVTGMAARSVIPIPHAHYLGKKELFDGPLGWFFRLTGGVPVDRQGQKGMVDQVVDEFHRRTHFVLALSPEGTRKKVTRLKSGFWHIAKQANVPIVMAGMDFSSKELKLANPFYPGNDPNEDWPAILAFFRPLRGKNPECDMHDLK